MSRSSKSNGAIAPKERINISYKPATGSAKENVELPFKLLVLGDFTQKPDNTVIEKRTSVNVNKHNFDTVMEDMDLSLNLEVNNKITNKGKLNISLDINSLKDFEPDNIVANIAELQEVIKLREALKALKGPLGNSPEIRHGIQAMLTDEKQRAQLQKELGE